jgi:hypothetical protein
MKPKLHPLLLALGLAVGNPAHAYDPVLEWTGSMTGGLQLASMNFTITDTSLPYIASLLDNGFLAPFDFLALGVFKTGGAQMGSVIGVGAFTFTAPVTGAYTAIVVGDPGATPFGFSSSTFGVTVTPIPEPDIWAMLLAGLWLVGLQLRRKLKASRRIGLG